VAGLGNRGRVGLLGLVLGLMLIAPGAAWACPADGGPAPAGVKNAFCATWDRANQGGNNLGSPLNNAYRSGPGWARDFDGGAWGRGVLVMGDSVGWAYVIGQPWFGPYSDSGGPAGPLGYPTGRAEFGGHINDGPNANKYMTLQGGVINSWAGGTFETHGAILSRWNELGHVSGPVGRPLSNEGQTARVNGRYSKFEGGNLYFHPALNKVLHIYGGILNKYAQLGYSNHALGLPTSDRKTNPDRGNEYQTFDGGVINQYGGNAYETHGPILGKWESLGGPNGPVGLPTSDVGNTARVAGNYQKFEGGNLYFNPRVNGSYQIYGGILNKYAQLGYSNHALGLPTSDRKTNPDRGNEYQTFDGGVINQYGGNAYETHGPILDRWAAEGGANGWMGLPTSDVADTARSPSGAVGQYTRFQSGIINAVGSKTFVLNGAIGDKYGSLGYAASYLGLPTSDEFDSAGGRRQNFEGGFIVFYNGRAQTDRELSGSTEGLVAQSSLTDDPPGTDNGPPPPPPPPGGGDGTSGGTPVPPPPNPTDPNPSQYVFRAFGDSVTAGFGHTPAGHEIDRTEMLGWCVPHPEASNCSSPRIVAYPAQFARMQGIDNWKNFAVSGSEPRSWLDLKPFQDQLDELEKANPDLVAVTLGANPILGTYLESWKRRNWDDAVCSRFNAYVAGFTNCIADKMDDLKVVSRLNSIYTDILRADDPHTTLAVFLYHYTYPDLGLGANVRTILGELNARIASAVSALPPDLRSRVRLLSPAPPGAFEQHQCHADQPWILQADFCIHPNLAGHNQFAASLAKLHRDARVPAVNLQAPGAISARVLAKKGLPIAVDSDELATGVAAVERTPTVRRLASASSRGEVVGGKTFPVGWSGGTSRIRIGKALWPRLGGTRKRPPRRIVLRVATVDSTGNSRYVSRTVRVRR